MPITSRERCGCSMQSVTVIEAASQHEWDLIVILPAHNERPYILEAVETTSLFAQQASEDWLIVVAEDGSTDGTDRLANALDLNGQRVRHIHSDVKLGRGRAVRNAMRKFDAAVYAYLDTDLATDMTSFHVLVDTVRKGADIALGSRYTDGATSRRPTLRRFASQTYNWLVRRLFNTGIHDHQCGFRAFSHRVRDELLDACKSDHWLWDTEIIVMGQRLGFRIHEFSVDWTERRRTTTSLRRLLSDMRIHGVGLLRLFWRIHRR